MAIAINVTLAQIIMLCFILEAQWLEPADNGEWNDALKKKSCRTETEWICLLFTENENETVHRFALFNGLRYIIKFEILI